MNDCLVTLQDLIFFCYRSSWISSCECPHRLSDKLLKSSELRAFAANSRWRILRFPLSESTLISGFFSATPGDSVKLFTCSVSMEAHYRDPIFSTTPF
ncbi:hypothetical protein AV650_27835 [Serratia fonticola]|nr:hypothetical protein AV650_27835 [Serratia fonticola]